MEQSCETPHNHEEKRPVSSKFVELHVLYVPNDQWNVKLNKVPVEAIDSFVSAGFIRVYPDITLKSLRSTLNTLLGRKGSMDKFFFLKCVGHSLALVKSKQERDVKVKTFAPPYAPQPELYLLRRVVENDSSVRSQSLTPDTSSGSSDQASYLPLKTSRQQTGTKELVKFPHINKCLHQVPPDTQLPPDEGQEEEHEEDHSYSSSEGENQEKDFKLKWDQQERCQRKPQLRSSSVDNVFKESDADPTPSTLLPKERMSRKTRAFNRGSRAARDSGVAESLDDTHSGFSLSDRHGKLKESCAVFNRTEQQHEAISSPGVSQSLQCSTKFAVRTESLATDKTVASPFFRANKQELTEELKLVREERKELEWMRQELLRKGKDLLAQNRHRRNQARDSWKKKYFETKKATAPLEENLRNLRQELETFYGKLLHQLHARETRSKPKRQGRSSVKNELIIQIMTESYEIDDLKRKVEDAKMKLLTEIKLRKQAATELRALKAELAQKKSQSSHQPTVTYFGNITRDRAPPSNSV